MPLSGTRVLDLTRVLSGPYCTALLADMGAEVIKIESPSSGDPVREQGVIKNGLSWYFANYNRNKKSVAIDLYSQAGKDLLARMIPHCDVVVDNFRPGVMTKMGFGPEQLKALRRDIVYCSINGFGTSGPYKDRPAFDFIAQAMSGFMSLNGNKNEPPLRAAPPLSDLIAGTNAALGIVAALLKREQTGQGDTVSVSLLHSMIAMLSFHACNFLASGQVAERTGNDHGIVAPYGLFETRDGQVAIAPSNDMIYARLLTALDLSGLAHQPEFRTNADRIEHRQAIKREIEARTKQETTSYWIEKLNDMGVPCGPVLGLEEVIADPQVQDQNMVMDIAHPGHGNVAMLNLPIQFEQPTQTRQQPAPALGENTREVLASFGLEDTEISTLFSDGIIGCPEPDPRRGKQKEIIR